MTGENMYEVIGDISDKYIREAKQQGKRKQPIWLKWSAVAACLFLVVGLGIPIITHKGNLWQKDPSKPYDVVEFNGAYYEVVREKDILDKYHLPTRITEEMIGMSLGKTLDPSTGKPTERIMYQYAPYSDIVTLTTQLKQKRSQSAVYILRDGDAYSFALFCNFIHFDSNTHTEAGEMFVVYGIDEAEDIASITIGKKEITDPVKIKTIFDNMYHSYAMGNDDFQNTFFKGMSEEKQHTLSSELADSAVELKILTNEGLSINHITYYPTINYLSWALNYYRLDTSIEYED